MAIKVFSRAYLDELTWEAKNSPRFRKNRNIHVDYDEPCQRLFNAIEPNSYIQPHCHGVESLFAVRGLLALIIFDDFGGIVNIQPFGADSNKFYGNVAIGTETSSGEWHTVVSLEAGSILLEIKAGPFDPTAPKFLAPWSPSEGALEGKNYLERLLLEVRRKEESLQ